MNENPEFPNEPARVTAHFAAGGSVEPQVMQWRGRTWTIVALGRQWLADGNRHVLVETAGGARFELELRSDGLSWWVRRYWPAGAVV
jgi:hypothetical protein